MEIPKKFYDIDEETPVAYTVGELVEILKELPADLPIHQGFGDGVTTVVYNYGADDCCLEFEEA